MKLSSNREIIFVVKYSLYIMSFILCNTDKQRYIVRACDIDDRRIFNYEKRFKLSNLEEKIDRYPNNNCSTHDDLTGSVTVCKCVADLCNSASVMSYCLTLVIAVLTSLLTSS